MVPHILDLRNCGFRVTHGQLHYFNRAFKNTVVLSWNTQDPDELDLQEY